MVSNRLDPDATVFEIRHHGLELATWRIWNQIMFWCQQRGTDMFHWRRNSHYFSKSIDHMSISAGVTSVSQMAQRKHKRLVTIMLGIWSFLMDADD